MTLARLYNFIILRNHTLTDFRVLSLRVMAHHTQFLFQYKLCGQGWIDQPLHTSGLAIRSPENFSFQWIPSLKLLEVMFNTYSCSHECRPCSCVYLLIRKFHLWWLERAHSEKHFLQEHEDLCTDVKVGCGAMGLQPQRQADPWDVTTFSSRISELQVQSQWEILSQTIKWRAIEEACIPTHACIHTQTQEVLPASLKSWLDII